MKLHFYFIEKPWGKEPYIRYEDVEADEKPKTYILKELPNRFYSSRILKGRIGIMLADFQKNIILLERDDERAKQIFSEYYKTLISDREKEIAEYKSIIKTIGEWEG